jgi:FkbM family methyltransferase
VITTKQKRDEFINSGSEIEKELYEILNKDSIITIADIGACDGLSTIIYSKMFPGAKFHVFEPIGDNASEAVRNFMEYNILDRVEMHICALSNQAGRARFYKSKGQAPGTDGWDTGNKSSSLLRPKRHLTEHKWCEFDQDEVRTERLDFFELQIDFAHIDVQGAELMVIKGGIKTLSKAKAIWIEVANIELYAGQALKSQVSSALSSIGFRCKLDTCGNKKYGDMLWVK